MTTIATKDQFKEHFGVKGTDDDPLIVRLLNAADSIIYPYLGRKAGSLIAPYAFTLTKNGNGNDRMVLPFYPIVSISSVVLLYRGAPVQETPLTSASWTFGTEENMDSRVVYLLNGYRFPLGRQNVIITGTSGYAEMPDSLVQGELEIAGKMYYERKRLGETSKHLGGETVSGYSLKSMLESTKLALDPYRNRFPG